MQKTDNLMSETEFDLEYLNAARLQRLVEDHKVKRAELALVDQPVIDQYYDEMMAALFRMFLLSKDKEETWEIQQEARILEHFRQRLETWVKEGSRVAENRREEDNDHE